MNKFIASAIVAAPLIAWSVANADWVHPAETDNITHIKYPKDQKHDYPWAFAEAIKTMVKTFCETGNTFDKNNDAPFNLDQFSSGPDDGSVLASVEVDVQNDLDDAFVISSNQLLKYNIHSPMDFMKRLNNNSTQVKAAVERGLQKMWSDCQ